jgi:trk system potassium uptake protein TrkH
MFSRIRKEGLGAVLRDSQVVTLLSMGLFFTVAVVITLVMTSGWSLGDALIHGTLTAWSAQTTAGFSSISPDTLPSATLLLLIFAMLTGGGAGSTAGGIKILRIVVLGRVLTAALIRPRLSPHAVHEPMLGGHRIKQEDVEDAWRTLLLFVVVVLLSWFAFLLAGYEPLASLFEVASATGTVGLSTGITSSDLPTWLKMVLCLDMWMGRLEVFALLVFANPLTWVGATLKKDQA